MKILEYLNTEIVAAYKSGESDKRVLLQTLKSSLLNKQKEKGELSPEDEIQVLKNEQKLRRESLEQFKAANRTDLVEKTEAELAVIDKLLPEQMGEDEVKTIVQKIYDGAEDKSFGAIMKMAMAELKGKADGSVVSRIVKEISA